MLKSLKVWEAIVSFGRQTDIWLPDDRDEACSVTGKFTQGSVADGKRLTRRLVVDQGELDFLVRDTRQSGTLVGAPQKCPVGHILNYYDGSQPQYIHLRASMLAYAHIDLLSMLSMFTPYEAVRVAIDNIYVRKSALKRLEEVEAFIPMNKPGLEAAVRASGGVFSGNLGAPSLSSGRHKAAEHHGHHLRALTGGQAKSTGACPERRC